MKVCAVEGCGRRSDTPGTARGLCQRHYRRFRFYGDPTGSPGAKQRSICSVDGCLNEAICKSLCGLHDQRKRRYGAPIDPPVKCRVCNHPAWREIDLAIFEMKEARRSIGVRFGVDVNAVHRHARKHLGLEVGAGRGQDGLAPSRAAVLAANRLDAVRRYVEA